MSKIDDEIEDVIRNGEDPYMWAVRYGRREGTKMWLITFVAPVLFVCLTVLCLRACG
jgi:hypothetical protein